MIQAEMIPATKATINFLVWLEIRSNILSLDLNKLEKQLMEKKLEATRGRLEEKER